MPQTKTTKRSTGSTSKRGSNGGSAKKSAAKTRSSAKSTKSRSTAAKSRSTAAKSRPTATKSRSDGLADKAKVAALAGGAALIGVAGGAVATKGKGKGKAPLGLLGRRSRTPKLKAPVGALKKLPKAGASLLPKTNGSAFDWVEEKAKEVGDASYRLAAATSEAHRVKNSLTDGK